MAPCRPAAPRPVSPWRGPRRPGRHRQSLRHSHPPVPRAAHQASRSPGPRTPGRRRHAVRPGLLRRGAGAAPAARARTRRAPAGAAPAPRRRSPGRTACRRRPGVRGPGERLAWCAARGTGCARSDSSSTRSTTRSGCSGSSRSVHTFALGARTSCSVPSVRVTRAETGPKATMRVRGCQWTPTKWCALRTPPVVSTSTTSSMSPPSAASLAARVRSSSSSRPMSRCMPGPPMCVHPSGARSTTTDGPLTSTTCSPLMSRSRSRAGWCPRRRRSRRPAPAPRRR